MNEDIVTADARAFPLIGEMEQTEPLFSDRDSQLEIDALTPYVDLARMARERYESNPSIQNGARMSKDRNELVARMKRVTDSLCGRYPSATREGVWTELLKRFPSLKYIFQGEVAHV